MNRLILGVANEVKNEIHDIGTGEDCPPSFDTALAR
jgi:hypothetical protein